MFLSKCIFNENETDQNSENIRIKAMKENEISNLFIEFFSLFFIKGIALGFGFFYSFEIVFELKKIVKDISTPKNEEQINILHSILLNCTFMKWINLFTMIYLIWLYTIRFIESCFFSEEKKIILISNNAMTDIPSENNEINTRDTINVSSINDSVMTE